MKKLSNTEAELKKRVAYKKKCVYHHFLKVTSENIASIEKFLFHGKVMLCSRDIQCFVSLIISSTVKFLTPRRVFAHERGYFL